MLMTLALGLASVCFFHNLRLFEEPVDKELKEATFITAIPPAPKFTESIHSCGLTPSVDIYLAPNGEELTEGVWNCKDLKKGRQKVIRRDNSVIISALSDGKASSYLVYVRKTGHCISTPDINLGLEFEDFLNDRTLAKKSNISVSEK